MKKTAKKRAAKKPTTPGNGHDAKAAVVEEPVREAVLRRTVRLLPVKLSDVELITLGGKLADALQDVATESDRQSSQKKEMAARLSGMASRVTELSARLRRREEDREIQLEVRADFKEGVAREIRLDTGAVLLTRELTPAERQRPLFDAQTAEQEAANTNGAQTDPAPPPAAPETPAELPRCIECGEAIETSAAETCPGEGDLCDGGQLHPGCGGPHQAAHVAPEDEDDKDGDDAADGEGDGE